MPTHEEDLQQGLALENARDWRGAVDHYRAVLARRGDIADILFRLGHALRRIARFDEAAVAFDRATQLKPDFVGAWTSLGLIYQLQEKNDPAIRVYRRAITLSPENAEIENQLGACLIQQGQVDAAIASFQHAVALRPEYVDALVNLGNALQDRDRIPESITALETAVRLAPKNHLALGNLGNAYLLMNRLDDSRSAYEQALALAPANDVLRLNLGLVQLRQGNFATGLVNYEARQRTFSIKPALAFGERRWDGKSSLAGRSLLVFDEQGQGDTLQFFRYVPSLVARGARVSLRVQGTLKRLLGSQPGIHAVYTRDEPLPDFDCYCPFPSLPLLFGTRLDTIPARVPYLRVPAEKTAAWRSVFSRAPGLKVGLVWSGNPDHKADLKRSIPLEIFARLAPEQPAHFFSLQKQLRPADAEYLRRLPGLTDLSKHLHDFENTAAVVSSLDLVITVDTSVAHLAGALGVRVWLLLPFSADWRWLTDRSDSPWYPNHRLFRQPAPGDWPSVIASVRAALAEFVQRGSHAT